MKQWIRHILKQYLLIFKVRERFSAAVQIGQRALYHQYVQLRQDGRLPAFADTGYRVFSQFEEDGKLLFIFSIIGMGGRRFVEIGSDDGVNSNSANLYFNFDWTGLFVDGNPRSIRRGRHFFARYPHPWCYAPRFVCARVTRENINPLLEDSGSTGEIDLLSIDIDGNDYWIWDALTVITPRVVVVIETHNEFGLENIVVPYDPDYSPPGKHPLYHGASPRAMVALGRRKGYRLVGANTLGFNFFFVRNDLAVAELPEVSVESVLQHPSVAAGQAGFEAIRGWEYVRG